MDEAVAFSNDEILILDGRIELQDYRNYWLEIFKDSLPNTIMFWGTAVASFSLLAFWSRNSINVFIFFLFGALFLAFIPLLMMSYSYWAYIGTGRRYLAGLSEEERWTTVTFNKENDGFEWVNGRNYSYIAWSSIEDARETHSHFALKRQIHTYLLSKDMFKSETQLKYFKFLLKNKLGGKVKLLS